MKVIVKILTDHDIMNPSTEWDCTWKVYSFSNRHRSFQHPDKFDNIGIRRKLQVGTAFMLDYFEHSGCIWSLSGAGPQCRWDTTRNAGIMLFENPKDMGAKTYEDRAKDAKNFLEIYTDWANGYGHGYSIETEEGEIIDSCFGFYDSEADHTVSEIISQLEHLRQSDPDLEVELEDSDLFGYTFRKVAEFNQKVGA